MVLSHWSSMESTATCARINTKCVRHVGMRYGFVPLVLNGEHFHLRTHQYKMCQTRWNALWFCPIGPQWRALPPAHASIQNVSDTLECVMVLSHWSSMESTSTCARINKNVSDTLECVMVLSHWSSMQSAFTCARINTKCVRHVGMRYGFVPLVLNGERFHLRTHQYKMCQTHWNALWFCPIGPQWRALPPAHASIQNVSDTLESVMVLFHWSSMESASTCARINDIVSDTLECVMVLSHWSSMESAFTCALINTKCVRHVGMRYGFVPLVLNGEHFHLRTHQYKMCQTRWNPLWFCPIGPQWRALPPAHASMTLCQTRWNALWFCPIGPQWRALPPAHSSIQNVSDTLECVMVLSHWSSMESTSTCARINTKCVRHVGIRYGFVPLVLNGERFHLRTHQ